MKTYTTQKLWKMTLKQLKNIYNNEFGKEIFIGEKNKYAYFVAVKEECEQRGMLV